MRPLLLALALASLARAGCLPLEKAESNIGRTACVQGKVLKISQGPNGVQYIDFCDDHARCSFSGVVFADDLRDVGDIRTLPGKMVEIHGQLRGYDGHAEIIVSEARQVRGAGVRLPPVPKAYDVEERGHFSAGRFRHPRKPKVTKPKRHPPLPPGGVQVPPDEPR